MGQSGRVLRGRKATGDAADDVKRQVDSNDGSDRPIYQLANVKTGGGKLIEIIKANARHSSGSFNMSKSIDSTHNNNVQDSNHQIERQIHELVEPLLYNKGAGKLVAMSEIWRMRLGSASKLPPDGTDGPREDEQMRQKSPGPGSADEQHRWVCWRLDERGYVGETALHICFLVASPTHMVLAKKLLTIFPMLIYDIYTCDQYFGESSLHMAIVNEDVRILKLLLDHGSNVHDRCLGSFFVPDDQKDSANVAIREAIRARQDQDQDRDHDELQGFDLQSNHFNSLRTNYHGYAYWGEYPLSFAACLGLADCYKLLLAKGANPNRQDSNGNSTLHMAVIADRKDMFDLCYATGAQLNIVNKQKLTPLALAARLKRDNLFFHILAIHRQVYWMLCNVAFVEMPLDGLDTIGSVHGAWDETSVLSIVVFGSSNEHLSMLDGLMSQLLTTKWANGLRSKFHLCLCQFLFIMLLASLAYVKRFDVVPPTGDFVIKRHPHSNGSTLSPASLNSQPPLPTVTDFSFNLRWHFVIVLDLVTSASEYLLALMALLYLSYTLWRLNPKLKLRPIIQLQSQAPELCLFGLTCIMILCCIPLRALGWRKSEDFVAAVVMFTMPLGLLFFCRASTNVGSFVVMIYKIVVNDVLCFVVFLVIFVAGFSQSFLIMFKSYEANESLSEASKQEENHFVNLFDGIISMHMMAMNEFGIVFDQFQATNYSKLAKFMFCVYMVLVSILLINMLIAMLGKTYQDIASQPNENLRQWARALLLVERLLSRRQRLDIIERYSRLNTDGTRLYGSTWPLTPEDRVQVESMGKLKDENKRNSKRLDR